MIYSVLENHKYHQFFQWRVVPLGEGTVGDDLQRCSNLYAINTKKSTRHFKSKSLSC